MTAMKPVDRESFAQLALEWRYVDAPCKKCGGCGKAVYSDTTTWRHGVIGGQALTVDVCDACWGSGDHAAPWPSWK